MAQVETADVLVLNKGDLLTKEQLDKLQALLAQLNPSAVQHVTKYGRTPLSIILGTGARQRVAVRGGARCASSMDDVGCVRWWFEFRLQILLVKPLSLKFSCGIDVSESNRHHAALSLPTARPRWPTVRLSHH